MAVTLRPYQLKLKADIYKMWESDYRNVLAVLPTGMGKTKLFANIAIDQAIGNKLPTVIMVHRKELVAQISMTLAEEGIVHNIIAPKGTVHGIISQHRMVLKRNFYWHGSNVSVISVDTLNARSNRYVQWAQSIRFKITDEAAHVLKANKWGRAWDFFPNAIGLGVTATPQRLDKRGLGAHADGVFDVMVQGPTTREGIEGGFLSPYKIAIPQSDYRNFLKVTTGDADYTREAMAEASEKSHIVGDAVLNYKKFAHNKQAIYFCTDTHSAKKMEQKFRDAGVNAKLLTADTPDQERFNAVEDFKNKKIKVLLNIDLFDEGFDCPGIEVVGMCRPTKSVSKYLQMCGRGLRPLPGKQFCIIIDHVGNYKDEQLRLPDTKRNWTLNRIVRRRDKTSFVRVCGNILCNAPYDRVLTACPYCGEEVPKPSASEGGGRPGPAQVDGDLELLDSETLRQMDDKSRLEDPGVIGKRIAEIHGAAAGLKAQKNQVERIAMQTKLVTEIAQWAGRRKHEGMTDRQINKKFYLDMGMTISEALSEPRAEMQTTIERIREGCAE